MGLIAKKLLQWHEPVEYRRWLLQTRAAIPWRTRLLWNLLGWGSGWLALTAVITLGMGWQHHALRAVWFPKFALAVAVITAVVIVLSFIVSLLCARFLRGEVIFFDYGIVLNRAGGLVRRVSYSEIQSFRFDHLIQTPSPALRVLVITLPYDDYFFVGLDPKISEGQVTSILLQYGVQPAV